MNVSFDYSSDDDDDDELNAKMARSSNIHDLDHAPSPPPELHQSHWPALQKSDSFRKMLEAAISPRSGSRRTISVPPQQQRNKMQGGGRGAGGFLRNLSSRSLTSSNSAEPNASPPRSKRIRLLGQKQQSLPPLRQRANSQPPPASSIAAMMGTAPAIPIATTTTTTPDSPTRGMDHATLPPPANHLTHMHSFPPSASASPSHYNVPDDVDADNPPRQQQPQIIFANSRDSDEQRGMLFIPEVDDDGSGGGVEEAKEALSLSNEDDDYDNHDEPREFPLTGKEIDSGAYGVTKNNNNSSSSGSIITPTGRHHRSHPKWSGESLDFDEEDGFDGPGGTMDNSDDADTVITSNAVATFLGFPLPPWLQKRRPSWNRVAIFVVEKAPCFFCRRMPQATYKSVLVRLNMLSAFFALGQVASAGALYVIMLWPTGGLVDRDLPSETQNEVDNQSNFEVLTNVWNLNGAVLCLGILGVVMLVSIFFTRRAFRNVSLKAAIRYLWLLLWVLPLQIYWCIGMFDYFRVTDVWIKFWWRDRTMAWFRRRYCEPPEVANTRCAVPVFEFEAQATVRASVCVLLCECVLV